MLLRMDQMGMVGLVIRKWIVSDLLWRLTQSRIPGVGPPEVSAGCILARERLWADEIRCGPIERPSYAGRGRSHSLRP